MKESHGVKRVPNNKEKSLTSDQLIGIAKIYRAYWLPIVREHYSKFLTSLYPDQPRDIIDQAVREDLADPVVFGLHVYHEKKDRKKTLESSNKYLRKWYEQ